MLPTDITLRPGDSGDSVFELQRRLAARGLLSENGLSWVYDDPTTQAVVQFQSMNGLRSDGIAGPATLRLLVSFGGAAGSAESSGSGDGESGDQEEDREADKERRFDEHELAMEEQRRGLEQQAVWGYGLEQTQQETAKPRGTGKLKEGARDEALEAQERLEQQRAQGQEAEQAQTEKAQTEKDPQQLRFTKEGMEARTPIEDLNEKPIVERETPEAIEKAEATGKEAQREAAREEQAQQSRQTAQQAEQQPDRQADKAPQAEAPAQADAKAHMAQQQEQQEQQEQQSQQQAKAGPEAPEQIKVSQQGMEARTPMEELNETPVVERKTPEPEPKAEAKPDAPPQHSGPNGASPDMPEAQAAALEVAQPRDPALARTEAQLDGGSQQASQREGEHLHARGVREDGLVTQADLGELSPERTPHVERERAAGIGM